MWFRGGENKKIVLESEHKEKSLMRKKWMLNAIWTGDGYTSKKNNDDNFDWCWKHLQFACFTLHCQVIRFSVVSPYKLIREK